MVSQALGAVQSEASAQETSGMQPTPPSADRRRHRSALKPGSPVSPSTAGTAASPADAQGAYAERMPSAMPSMNAPVTAPAIATAQELLAQLASQTSQPADTLDLTPPMALPLSMPGTPEPALPFDLTGYLLSPTNLTRRLERTPMGSTTSHASSMLGIGDTFPAVSSGAATLPAPSTVSTASLLEPVRGPEHSDLGLSMPGRIIQGLQYQATRQLSMSPSTTSAAFPDVIPGMFDAPRCQPPSPGITGPGLAMGFGCRPVAFLPGTTSAALPAGVPSQGLAPAACLPFSTAAQHHHHFHHHHHHRPGTMPLGRPFPGTDSPAGGPPSELLNRRAELQLHGVPLDSPPAVQRQPGADALSELQDRRAELELHGIQFASAPREPMPAAQQRTPGASPMPFGSHRSGERHDDLQPPAAQQSGYQGFLQPQSQQMTGRMQSQVDPLRRLQPIYRGMVQNPSQQAPLGLQQMQPDPFWRAVPRIVAATDFSENASALSGGNTEALLEAPEATGLQATAPSRLSRTTSAELGFPNLELPGQALSGPQPFDGWRAAFPHSPEIPLVRGLLHGPVRFGLSHGNAGPVQQMDMRQAPAMQPMLPPEFDLVLPAIDMPGPQLQISQRQQPRQPLILRQPCGQGPSALTAPSMDSQQV